MNERLIVHHITVSDPTEGAAVGQGEAFYIPPLDETIVYACAAPRDDDPGATVDIQDDTADIITAIDASDANVPGTWTSTHLGGSETPQRVAAGSKVEFDINNAAVANQFYITVYALTSEMPA